MIFLLSSVGYQIGSGTAMLLSVFVGYLGVDQFYAGNVGFGIGKLLTIGGLGVWWTIDTVFWIIGSYYRGPGC